MYAHGTGKKMDQGAGLPACRMDLLLPLHRGVPLGGGVWGAGGAGRAPHIDAVYRDERHDAANSFMENDSIRLARGLRALSTLLENP